MGKFLIKPAKNGPMFVLKARNGEVIGSSEVYSNMSACKNGIEAVKKAAAAAKIEDQTKAVIKPVSNPKFEIYKDKIGQFRYRLVAKNGEIVLAGEGYVSKDGCKNGIKSIIKNAAISETVSEINE